MQKSHSLRKTKPFAQIEGRRRTGLAEGKNKAGDRAAFCGEKRGRAEIQALQEMLTAQEKAQQEWQVMLFMQEKLLLEKKAQEQTIARKREFIEGIEALLQQKADIAKKERDLQGMQKKYLAAEGAWQAAKAEATQAETLYLREQAGFLAENLTEGMACPVCGATHHPHKAALTENAIRRRNGRRKRRRRKRQARLCEENLNKRRLQGKSCAWRGSVPHRL